MKMTKAVCVLMMVLLLAACGGSGGAGSGTGASTAASSKVFHWKMVTTWPANFPVFQEGAEKFAKDVRVMSDGRLDISVYAGGELVPPLGVFDAVSQGTVEMGHGSPYYWAGKVPAAQFFSSVPFGMTASGMNAWLYHGGGLKLWREIYKPFNLVPFPGGNTGVQMGGWFNKKIESINDIKGLRMRIPGLGGKVLAAAGGNPVLMAGGEIYTALDRGAIDATEWVGPFHDMRLGLNRAATYYYYPGWHEPGTEFEFIINSRNWAELPDDLKKIVEVAAQATTEWIFSAMDDRNGMALKKLEASKKVQILEFPDEVLQELKKMTKKTLDEEAAKDPDFKRVYDAYTAYRDQYADWHRLEVESARRYLKKK